MLRRCPSLGPRAVVVPHAVFVVGYNRAPAYLTPRMCASIRAAATSSVPPDAHVGPPIGARGSEAGVGASPRQPEIMDPPSDASAMRSLSLRSALTDENAARGAVAEAERDLKIAREAWRSNPTCELHSILERREAALKDRIAEREKVDRAYAASVIAAKILSNDTKFSVPSKKDILFEMGSLAMRPKHFEIPAVTMKVLEGHVAAMCATLGCRVDKSAPANLAVAATAGSGKTTFLHYLRHTGDTVRYGASRSAQTNWFLRTWNASAPARPVCHVFVAFATFNTGQSKTWDERIDTTEAIERRCVWRILNDAGLVGDWSDAFDLRFKDASQVLRQKVSVAEGCEPAEVAVVVLVDEVTKPTDGPRAALLDALATWQQNELRQGVASMFVVAGLSLFPLGDKWVTGSQRRFAALPLPPLNAVPKRLVREIDAKKRRDPKFTRWLELRANVGAAGGHPRTLEYVAAAISSKRSDLRWPAPSDAEGLLCVWRVFAKISGASSVNAEKLVSEPSLAVTRGMLNINCLRFAPETTSALVEIPNALLTAAPSALFHSQPHVWDATARSAPHFPNRDAALAVRELLLSWNLKAIRENWELGFAGGLHLLAQCSLRHKKPADSTQPVVGLVPFKKLLPGCIIGHHCVGLEYDLRQAFCHSVERHFTKADFDAFAEAGAADASCLHTTSPTQKSIEYSLAASLGGSKLHLGVQLKFRQNTCPAAIDTWVQRVIDFFAKDMSMPPDNFRVLLCVTGLTPKALQTIQNRAADPTHALSRAIIVNTGTAKGFFKRLGVWSLVVAAKDR